MVNVQHSENFQFRKIKKNFQFGQYRKFQISKIPKMSNLENSENL